MGEGWSMPVKGRLHLRAIQRRNQFDYFRALPGGLVGLANITQQFHQRGVRVLWGFLSCGAASSFFEMMKHEEAKQVQSATVSMNVLHCFAIPLISLNRQLPCDLAVRLS